MPRNKSMILWSHSALVPSVPTYSDEQMRPQASKRIWRREIAKGPFQFPLSICWKCPPSCSVASFFLFFFPSFGSIFYYLLITLQIDCEEKSAHCFETSCSEEPFIVDPSYYNLSTPFFSIPIHLPHHFVIENKARSLITKTLHSYVRKRPCNEAFSQLLNLKPSFYLFANDF